MVGLRARRLLIICEKHLKNLGSLNILSTNNGDITAYFSLTVVLFDGKVSCDMFLIAKNAVYVGCRLAMFYFI